MPDRCPVTCDRCPPVGAHGLGAAVDAAVAAAVAATVASERTRYGKNIREATQQKREENEALKGQIKAQPHAIFTTT